MQKNQEMKVEEDSVINIKWLKNRVDNSCYKNGV